MFFKKFLNNNLPKREQGQGLVEYALILVLVAVVVIAILLILGPAIGQVYCKVTNALQAGSCSFGVTITSGPTVTSLGGGVFRVQIGVQVPEATSVTLSAGGKTDTVSNCNTSCPLQVTNVPASGTYSITTGAGGSAGGNYSATP